MRKPLPFTKVQSIGNDFVLVDLEDVDPSDLPEIARLTSNRHFAIGSDGLLAVGPDHGRLVLRMFNSDGSEDFCGNGIRCAALYGLHRGWTGPKADICHFGQCVQTEVLEGGLVYSEFEPASFDPRLVPILSDRELFMKPIDVGAVQIVASAVTTGSTHTVILASAIPDDETFYRLGPMIEHHPLFPQRTSVIWAVPNPKSTAPSAHAGEQTINIRIWERGVGETIGCGTGSAAAAAVYLRSLQHEANDSSQREPSSRSKNVDSSEFKAPDPTSPIYVINPGGVVQVSMKSLNAPIISSAVAEILYTATF